MEIFQNCFLNIRCFYFENVDLKLQLTNASAICLDKIFFSWTKSKLSKTKVLSKIKKSIFCFQKSIKWNFLIERALKTCFWLEIFNLNDFWKQKMDFYTMDKTFVLDNCNIVVDKIYFVRADGRGIGITLVCFNMSRPSRASCW